jgi:hypothetical protein
MREFLRFGKYARGRETYPPSGAKCRSCASGVFQAGFWFGGFFNLHIAKLFGVKDLATIQALDIFGVFVPGDDAYPRVFADGCHRSWYRWKKYSSRQIVSAFPSI